MTGDIPHLERIPENWRPEEERRAMKTYSYDTACERLARYFLGGLESAKQDEVEELAQHIQDSVEGWFGTRTAEAYETPPPVEEIEGK